MELAHENGLLWHDKICTRGDLVQQVLLLREKHQRIVFTNGCFDILHPGHVDLLARAKSLGDVLILGLNTDASVRTLGKGDDRPINPFEVRAFVLAHLQTVDFVCGFEEETPLELIQLIRPDILVKGGDWGVGHIVGEDFVTSYGGEVFSLPLIKGFSTSVLIEKIRHYSFMAS